MIAPADLPLLVTGARHWPDADDDRARLLAAAEEAGWPALLVGELVPIPGDEAGWRFVVALLTPDGIASCRAALHALRHFPTN